MMPQIFSSIIQAQTPTSTTMITPKSPASPPPSAPTSGVSSSSHTAEQILGRPPTLEDFEKDRLSEEARLQSILDELDDR